MPIYELGQAGIQKPLLPLKTLLSVKEASSTCASVT